MVKNIFLSFLSAFTNLKAALVFGLLILLVQGMGGIYRSYLERNWTSIVDEEEKVLTRYLQEKFEVYRENSDSGVRSLLMHPTLIEFFDHQGRASTISLFELLDRKEDSEIMLEVYDASKIIRGWSGNRGPSVDTSLLQRHTVSSIIEGPIYSYYVVSMPLFSEKSLIGYLVGKRLFDVQYPINNRFINSTYFTSTFTSTLNISPVFAAPDADLPDQDSLKFSFTLAGPDKSIMARGTLERPQLSLRLAEAAQFTEQVSGIFGLVALFIVFRLVISRIFRNVHILWYLLIASGLVWITRYLMIWMNIPAGFLSSEVFNPTYFASPFGFGLAKSLGDLFITSLFFLINVVFIVFHICKLGSPKNSNDKQLSTILKAVLAIIILALVAAFLLFMRGFIATVHSAVIDSSFTFNDPASITPSFELSLMLVTLFFLSCSFVLAESSIVMLLFNSVRRLAAFHSQLRVWILVGAALLLFGILYGLIVPNTLMSQTERAVLTIVFIVTAAWGSNLIQQEKPLLSTTALMIVTLIAICCVVPVLDNKIHDSDRMHVELTAHELVRPADNWMIFLLQTALDEIGNREATLIFREGSDEEVEKLGFTQWAKSILSKEGNDCSVTFINNEGSVVSDFHIGNVPHWYRRHAMDEMPRSTTFLTEGERTENGKLIKWYRGYKPVFGEDSTFLGGVWVEISGAQRRLPGSAQTEILRNNTQNLLDIRNRKLLTFEYFQGKLVSTTAETIPLDLPIPLKPVTGSDHPDGYWAKESIDGKIYEMYLVPENGESSTWLAVGMEDLNERWHIFSFLRYTLFFLVISAVISSLVFIVRKLFGHIEKKGFRAKLLTAFVIVSLTPMLVLAYLNREYAKERADEVTVQRLSSQTSVVVAEIEKKVGANLPVLISQFSDEQCEEIATTMGVDFNVFLNGQLQATSKPEMFTSELLDKFLNGSAYVNTILKRKNFYSETQVIGMLPYVVGYRPLVSESGDVIGAVAVPTLFRQQEVDEELTRRNVFLFGAYSLTFILSLVVGSIFANGIASPIRRLQRAAEQISQGNLEVSITKSGTDEIGDLERTFQQMAVELKQKQAQIVKAQRELAWKEMAQQVAHEIKNPLTPIKLSMQQLVQAYKDNAPEFGDVLRRVSTTILEQIEALSRIASEFSNFARMPRQNIELCDVHQVIVEAVNLFRSALLNVSTEFKADVSGVLADREELRRVFINIIRNSVQAMKGTGNILIKTSSDEKFLDITIQDSGPGIPKEIQHRLFEMNFSTKTDGMGIGLTIVQTTIQNLGGTIKVTSTKNQGTTVSIHLPAQNS